MRSLWWALMQYSWCPHTRGKFGHRDTNRSETMWRDTGEDGHLQAKERGLAWILPQPSESTKHASTLTWALALNPTTQSTSLSLFLSLSPFSSYILSGSVLKRSPCVASLGLMANLVQCTGSGSPDKCGSEDQGWCLGIRKPHLHEVPKRIQASKMQCN